MRTKQRGDADKLAINGAMDSPVMTFVGQLGVTNVVNRAPEGRSSRGCCNFHGTIHRFSRFGGVETIFRSHETLERFVQIVPSDSNGLGFWQSTIAELTGNVLSTICYFGRKDKIRYVHFRFAWGAVTAFSETCIDEGHVDPTAPIQTY